MRPISKRYEIEKLQLEIKKLNKDVNTRWIAKSENISIIISGISLLITGVILIFIIKIGEIKEEKLSAKEERTANREILINIKAERLDSTISRKIKIYQNIINEKTDTNQNLKFQNLSYEQQARVYKSRYDSLLILIKKLNRLNRLRGKSNFDNTFDHSFNRPNGKYLTNENGDYLTTEDGSYLQIE